MRILDLDLFCVVVARLAAVPPLFLAGHPGAQRRQLPFARATPFLHVGTPKKRVGTGKKRLPTPKKPQPTRKKRVGIPKKRVGIPKKRLPTPKKPQPTPKKRVGTRFLRLRVSRKAGLMHSACPRQVSAFCRSGVTFPHCGENGASQGQIVVKPLKPLRMERHLWVDSRRCGMKT